MNYQEIYQTLSAIEKNEFFMHLLDSNQEIRNAFIARFSYKIESGEVNITYVGFCDLVQTKAQEWKEAFEDLELGDIDYEDYASTSHYVPEYEMAEMAAEEKIDDLFDNWIMEVSQFFMVQRFADGFACIAGMYHACNTAEVDDEYDSLGGDPNAAFLEEYSSQLKTLFAEVEKIHMNPEKLIQASRLFFRYIHEETLFPVALRKKFDVFFSMLTGDMQMAQAYAEMLKAYPRSKSDFPKLHLKISGFISPEEWLALAEEIYLNDPDIAKELMNLYLKNNQYTEFQRIARSCFLFDPTTYQAFIGERIKDDSDPGFAKMVLTSLTQKSHNIESYRRLAAVMNRDERLDFMEKNRLFTKFYGQMLIEEKMFEQLHMLLRNEEECSYFNFESLIFALIKVMPAASFVLLNERIISALKKNRNRDFYREVAQLLKSVKEHSFENEARNIARQLFNSKPTLPALRDELKKAGLV